MSDKPPLRLVVIESPFAGTDAGATFTNMQYVDAAIKDCLSRGEAPFAGHLMAGFLSDCSKEIKAAGMMASFAWSKKADLVAVYTDLGITSGMKGAITRAKNNGIAVEERSLPDRNSAKAPAES